MTEYTTTLSALRDANACQQGYNLIANHVGQDYAGTIPLETILDVNGLNDCIWALRATEGGRELAVAFGIYCAAPYYTAPDWVRWAAGWISGADRSPESAGAAGAAARAAHVAAYAARTEAYWTEDAEAYWTADAEAYWTADAAAYAAERQRQTEIIRKLIKGE